MANSTAVPMKNPEVNCTSPASLQEPLSALADPVHWKAKWIWMKGEASPRNFYLAARTAFTTPTAAADADNISIPRRLHISADTRYRLWLNGEWLGDGPARSFPMNQCFDTYDVTGLVRPGKNVLAVLVSHFGEATFQYCPTGQAGLLVQLERRAVASAGECATASANANANPAESWVPEVVSDETWRVRRHDGYVRPTLRISCQMPFEEIFDARGLDPEWVTAEGGGATRGFVRARVVAAAGKGRAEDTPAPWKNLTPRSVPQLTRIPDAPVRLHRAGLACPANLNIGLNLRPYFLPGDRMQNQHPLPGFVAARLVSPAEQTMQIFTLSQRFEPPVINGQQTPSGQTVRLQAGDNLFVIPLRPYGHHEFERSYAAFTESPVQIRGIFDEGKHANSSWTVFGPFDNYPQFYPQVLKFSTPADLEPYRKQARPIKSEDIVTAGSPWNETTVSRSVPGQPRIDNAGGLFAADASVTTIHPHPDGDVEVFLDFGQEQVGYLDLDLDATAGTILDFNFLEEIEDGLRIHYTYGNLSAVRYITRSGRQRFTSFLRKGFRYAKLTLRAMTAPVRVRVLRVLFSAYPSAQRGAFACSDPLLNRIWEVGRHTLLCCSEDTFTDCPTYEQTLWVGDVRNEALINYAAYGDLPLTRRSTELPAESLFRMPLPESHVPSGWSEIHTEWSYLWVMTVEEHWQWTGDRDFLCAIYPAVRTTMRNTVEQFYDSRGLMSTRHRNTYDTGGIDDRHEVVTVNELLIVESFARAAALAVVLGEADDAAWFESQRQALIAAINAHLWNEEKGAYVDALLADGSQSPKVSQPTNSMAILYRVAPPERLVRIRSYTTDPPQGMTRVGSPFALFFMLEELIATGGHATALDAIRQRWGEMIGHGATTFWETFPNFVNWWHPGEERKWWTRSYCHAWSSAPVYFLSRYQLGAWWAEPGYTKALVAPVPLDLTWAQGRVPTPQGEIGVFWRFEGEGRAKTFTIDVTLPPATAAQVILPIDPARYPVIEAGGYQAEIKDGRWTLELPAGASAQIVARLSVAMGRAADVVKSTI